MFENLLKTHRTMRLHKTVNDWWPDVDRDAHGRFAGKGTFGSMNLPAFAEGKAGRDRWLAEQQGKRRQGAGSGNTERVELKLPNGKTKYIRAAVIAELGLARDSKGWKELPFPATDRAKRHEWLAKEVNYRTRDEIRTKWGQESEMYNVNLLMGAVFPASAVIAKDYFAEVPAQPAGNLRAGYYNAVGAAKMTSMVKQVRGLDSQDFLGLLATMKGRDNARTGKREY